ncbi:hypothetical protein [Miltoncostaea marina]|uniref:hypothetical protein n=1 Tax=Miltoncostaea marina TaxID=2843215 RepID=UPI001C3C2958|nr:hypothetical protein [Miltoncostaea marina]
MLTNRKAPDRCGKIQLIDARDLWVRMRRSLGEKRREMTSEHVDEVTRLHGELADGPRVMVRPNDFFAYRRITVERPLRGYWVVDDTTWSDADGPDGPLAKLDAEQRAAALTSLKKMTPARYEDEGAARAALKAAIVPALGAARAPLLKALAATCFVRDPGASPVRDTKDQMLRDPELRDAEIVPWLEDVQDYLEEEVLPWAGDAYVTDPEGRQGYEIPFTRLFHQPIEPRSSSEIRHEIRALDGDFRMAIEAVLDGD